MKDAIESAAKASGRSMNAEVIARLEASFAETEPVLSASEKRWLVSLIEKQIDAAVDAAVDKAVLVVENKLEADDKTLKDDD